MLCLHYVDSSFASDMEMEAVKKTVIEPLRKCHHQTSANGPQWKRRAFCASFFVPELVLVLDC